MFSSPRSKPNLSISFRRIARVLTLGLMQTVYTFLESILYCIHKGCSLIDVRLYIELKSVYRYVLYVPSTYHPLQCKQTDGPIKWNPCRNCREPIYKGCCCPRHIVFDRISFFTPTWAVYRVFHEYCKTL